MQCSDPILFFPNVVFSTHFPHYCTYSFMFSFFFDLLLLALPVACLNTTSTAHVIVTVSAFLTHTAIIKTQNTQVCVSFRLHLSWA